MPKLFHFAPSQSFDTRSPYPKHVFAAGALAEPYVGLAGEEPGPTGHPHPVEAPARRQTVKKLLFITNTSLGDAVLTTGLLAKAIEQFWPCDVTIACGPTPAPLFKAVPGLQRIIVLDKKEKGVEWLRLLIYSAQIYWDAIIDLRNTFVSYMVLRKTVFRYTKIDYTQHKCTQLAKVMNLPKAPYNRIWLSDAVQEKALELLPDGAPILAICPTSGWRGKNWPPERLIELAQCLPFKRVAVLGAPNEREQVVPIMTSLRDKLEVIDLTRTDPLEAAACLARCRLCVANDSGLMHVSAAMGTPTLGLFGPTNDAVYAPHGPRAAIIRGAPYPGKKTADPHLLMQALRVDHVAEAAMKLLDGE